MNRKIKIIILILILSIIYLATTITLSIHLKGDMQILLNNRLETQTPATPIYEEKSLGGTDYGTVMRKGPYGNEKKTQRIAIIIGVHPQEAQAHQAIQKALEEKDKTLNYAYYLYVVNVTEDVEDYDMGRSHGEELANIFVVPDIVNDNFKLAIDIHSNAGHYEKKRFLYIPREDEKTYQIAYQLIKNLPWLELYQPPNPSSPKYVTIPLLQEGIPAIIYETYSYEEYSQIQEEAYQFIEAVDSINL